MFRIIPIWILVGGLEHFLFSHILGIIIPTDFHIFQRGGSTTNQDHIILIIIPILIILMGNIGKEYPPIGVFFDGNILILTNPFSTLIIPGRKRILSRDGATCCRRIHLTKKTITRTITKCENMAMWSAQFRCLLVYTLWDKIGYPTALLPLIYCGLQLILFGMPTTRLR